MHDKYAMRKINWDCTAPKYDAMIKPYRSKVLRRRKRSHDKKLILPKELARSLELLTRTQSPKAQPHSHPDPRANVKMNLVWLHKLLIGNCPRTLHGRDFVEGTNFG